MTLWTLANLSTPPVDWRDAKDLSLFTLGGAQGDNARPIAQVRSKGSNSSNALTTNGGVSRFENGFPTGMPAIVFDGGGSQPLVSENIDGFPIGVADCTIVLVASMSAAGFYPEAIDYGLSRAQAQRQIFATGSTRNLVASNNGADGDSGVDSSTGVVVIGVWRGGNLVETFTNGSRVPTQVSRAFDTGVGPMQLGVSGFSGAIAESAVIPYAVTSTDELDRISSSLAWKWGLQNKLAAANAYRTSAPEAAASGAVGSAASTLSSIVGAAAGTLLIVGSAAATLAPVLSAGAGGVRVTASVAVVLQPITGASTASSKIAAVAAGSLGPVTGAAAGTLPIGGTASASLGEITSGSAAQVAVRGNADVTLSAIVGSAMGGGTQTATASAAAILDSIVAAATGSVTITGAGAAPLGLILSAGAGSILARASAEVTLSPVASAAIGSVAIRGAAASALGEVLSSAAAYLPIAGRAVSQLGAVTSAASGSGDSVALEPIAILLEHRFVVPARQRRFLVPARQRAFVIREGICMSSITKRPAEERQYQADWSPDLNGQTIVGQIVATSSHPALIVDRVTCDGSVMRFWLQGGRAGRIDTISFRAATSGGETLEWDQTVTCE